MKNSLLLGLLIVLIGTAVFFSWDRYLNKNDFLTDTQIPCNPVTDSCFAYIDVECEGDDCTSYYKIIVAPAFVLKDCQPDEGACLLAKCTQSDACEMIFCSEETKTDFEIEDECSL